MTDITGEAQTRVEGAGDHPRTVETETASSGVFGSTADGYRRRVLAVTPGASAAMDSSTIAERVAESHRIEATQAKVI